MKPYKSPGKTKKQEVTEMFDNISPRYDLLNHLLSANIDVLWRRRTIKLLDQREPKTILDIATGTGDLAIAAAKLSPQSITGLDISPKMIELAKAKVNKLGLEENITMEVGDSEALRFKANSFDAVTVGFGVRNFGDLDKGLSEILRVLKPGGWLLVLEFSKPSAFPVKQLFGIYSKYVIPTVGSAISKDRHAYKYLPASVKEFPEGQAMLDRLIKVGFNQVSAKRLTFGVATIYKAVK